MSRTYVPAELRRVLTRQFGWKRSGGRHLMISSNSAAAFSPSSCYFHWRQAVYKDSPVRDWAPLRLP